MKLCSDCVVFMRWPCVLCRNHTEATRQQHNHTAHLPHGGHTLSTAEYARKYKISTETVRRRIREGRLQAELRDGVYWIKDPEADTTQDDTKTTQPDDTVTTQELLQEKDGRIADLKHELDEKNRQIEEILKQQDQGQQLAAMQQKTIATLTEQNQLLLEKEEKKVGFWGRLIGQRAWF